MESYCSFFKWGESIYTGEIEAITSGKFFKRVEKKPHGFGVSKHASGTYYRGQWVHGECTGLGVYTTVAYKPGYEFAWECEWYRNNSEGLGVDYCKSSGYKAEGERSTERGVLFGRRYTPGLLLTGHFDA
jgi:hypothetical protein